MLLLYHSPEYTFVGHPKEWLERKNDLYKKHSIEPYLDHGYFIKAFKKGKVNEAIDVAADLGFSAMEFMNTFGDIPENQIKAWCNHAIKNGMRGPITLYASGLSVLFWLIESISIYFILLAFGIDVIEFLTVIPTYTTSIMLGILSFLPMGIGVVEGTLTSFFTMHGIDISLALTIVVVIRLFTRWYSVSFGFIALKLSGGLTNNQEPNDSKS